MGDGGTPGRIDDILEAAFADLREQVYRPALRGLREVELDLVKDLAVTMAGEVNPSDSERVARQFATKLGTVYTVRAALEDQLVGARDAILMRLRARK